MKFKVAVIFFVSIYGLISCENSINSKSLKYDTSPTNIILQYTYKPEPGNFASDFSVTPAFTLFGDGRLIYKEPLVFPCMPSWIGDKTVYQPDFALLEIYLSKDEIEEKLNFVINKGFLTFNDKYVNPNSNKSELEVYLNLKHKKKRVISVGFSKPQEFLDICFELGNYYNSNAKLYNQNKIYLSCKPDINWKGNEPTWIFNSVNLETICNSVKGQAVSGQEMQDILYYLINVSRYYQFNGKYYVVYYKPALPYN